MQLSRRHFIKLAGLAGVGAVLPSCHIFDRIPPPSDHRNVIIIGSGFGGAITGLRLAEAGIHAMMIEKGKRWEITPDRRTFSRYIYPDGRSTWLRCATVVPIGPPLPINRFVGVVEGHFYRGLRVLTGSCYGGGSIVYGGLLVKPTKALFDQVFPDIDYGEMETYYQRVDAMLGREPVPEDIYQTEYFTHYRVVEEQNTNAGLPTARIKSASDWEIVRREIAGDVPPSIIHGEAIYGVDSGAKKSLDTSYLAQAEQSGFLEVKTLHQVKHIGKHNEGYWVQVEEINQLGCVIKKTVYSCNYLFLAAGSIGTSNLLVKARAKGFLPDLNDHVGQGWGNNGNVEVLRTNVGVPTGRWQGGPPATAVVDYDNSITPLFIEHPQLPLGFDCSCLLYFGIGVHSTKGEFFYNPIFDKVELDWPATNNNQETINQAMMNTMNLLNDVNGGEIGNLVGGSKGYQDDAVFHPLGGAVMGEACDFFGRVKNYPHLYVNDSALIPGSTAAANPSFTVAAFAERNIETLIEEDF